MVEAALESGEDSVVEVLAQAQPVNSPIEFETEGWQVQGLPG